MEMNWIKILAMGFGLFLGNVFTLLLLDAIRASRASGAEEITKVPSPGAEFPTRQIF